MSAIDHAHIVRLLGVHFATVPGFIVLEHMSQGDLKGVLMQRAEEHRPFTQGKTLDILTDLASAMSYLSSLRFVHRDVAARNVLVDKNDGVKLGDFGM